MIKRSLYYLTSLLVLAIVVTGLLAAHTKSVHAITGSDWNAGNIISDGIFYDNSQMSVSDIQNFLNSKVPSCDTQGIQQNNTNPSMTNAQYAASQGWPAPPYVCLKDYIQIPQATSIVDNYSTQLTKIADSDADATCTFNGAKAAPAGQGCSSAQIIKAAADAYSINPKVLIVTLQKESQNLIYDTWPLQSQYKNAMGYGCPDSAPCSAQYAGFFNQINNTAWQFQRYKANPSSYRIQPFQSPLVYYNPSNTTNPTPPPGVCGVTNVYIQNYATAGLYNYTPYQPNQAALNNLYGTGDSCSSYGNRNFWRTYSDWFYTTHYDYGWRIISQAAYADAAHTRLINTNDLSPNTTYYFHIVSQNIGAKTWTNSGSNPVRIGTAAANDRQSPICDTSWINCSRPATLIEASVAPGNNGTFDFTIHTPSNMLASNERFNLLAEGIGWMNDIGQYWPIATYPPNPYYYLLSQDIFYDSAYSKPANSSNLAANQSYYLQLKVLNGGNTIWTNSGSTPTRLGTSSPQNRSSQFMDSSWVASNRPAVLQENTVQPGEVGTFRFKINTPGTYGSYQEYFKPVTDGFSWMNEIGLYWQLNVNPPTPQWSYASEGFYTDNTKTTAINPNSISNNQRFYVSLKALNTGNTIWTNSGSTPTRLGTSSPQNRSSQFMDSSWVASGRPTTLQESSVAPGDTGTFEYWMQANFQPNGTLNIEHFTPLTEGQSWMNDAGMYVPVTYNTSNTALSYVGQGAYIDKAMTIPANLNNAARGTKYYLKLTVKNTGGSVWTNTGTQQIRLGTSNPNDRSSIFYDPSWLTTNRTATLQETSVAPGQTGTFVFTITTPSSVTATTNEYFRPVADTAGYWLDDLGIYWSITTP